MTANEGREQAWSKMLELHPFEFTDKMLFESGYNAALASIPAVPAATKELIEEARRDWLNMGDEGRIIHRLADALEALTGEQETRA